MTKAEGGGGEGVEDGGVRVLVVLLAVAIGLGNYTTWVRVWFGFYPVITLRMRLVVTGPGTAIKKGQEILKIGKSKP